MNSLFCQEKNPAVPNDLQKSAKNELVLLSERYNNLPNLLPSRKAAKKLDKFAGAVLKFERPQGWAALRSRDLSSESSLSGSILEGMAIVSVNMVNGGSLAIEEINPKGGIKW